MKLRIGSIRGVQVTAISHLNVRTVLLEIRPARDVSRLFAVYPTSTAFADLQAVFRDFAGNFRGVSGPEGAFQLVVSIDRHVLLNCIEI